MCISQMFIRSLADRTCCRFLLGQVVTRDHTMDQLDKYTKDMNFVIILSDAIRTAVDEIDETALGTFFRLLLQF